MTAQNTLILRANPPRLRPRNASSSVAPTSRHATTTPTKVDSENDPLPRSVVTSVMTPSTR